ncbi:MAG: hypothetical protein RR423_08500 [Hydrogenoanaerobacterium sp.]
MTLWHTLQIPAVTATNSVIAFSPLAQGLLAGVSKASQVRENINAAKNTSFTQG